MNDEQIEKVRIAIESADHIPTDKKAELLSLLSQIGPAIADASQAHADDARNVAKLIEASAHTAAGKEQQPEDLKSLLHELKQAAENFEVSHPHLLTAVTEYSTVLSALGI